MFFNLLEHGGDTMTRETALEAAERHITHQLKQVKGGARFHRDQIKKYHWYQWIKRKRSQQSIPFYQEKEDKYTKLLVEFNSGNYTNVVAEIELLTRVLDGSNEGTLINISAIEDKRKWRNVITALRSIPQTEAV